MFTAVQFGGNLSRPSHPSPTHSQVKPSQLSYDEGTPSVGSTVREAQETLRIHNGCGTLLIKPPANFGFIKPAIVVELLTMPTVILAYWPYLLKPLVELLTMPTAAGFNLTVELLLLFSLLLIMK